MPAECGIIGGPMTGKSIEPLLFPIREPDAPVDLVPVCLVVERGRGTGDYAVYLPTGYRFASVKGDAEDGLPPPPSPAQWIAEAVRGAAIWWTTGAARRRDERRQA